MTQYTFKSCTPEKHQEAILDLLLDLKEELYIPSRDVAEEIVTACFAQGGIIGAYDDKHLCGMLGYFLGDPRDQFVDKKLAFLYVAGILEPYRLSRIFRDGLTYSLYVMKKRGAEKIRLQAEMTNPYTNRLYGRFAKPLAEEKSLRGVPVITYGGFIHDALDYLDRRRKRSLPQAYDPTPHTFKY